MKVAIVKYNAGNIVSVGNALKRLGVDPQVTDDPDQLKSADKVIFPGVGEASTAMNYLKEKNLDAVIKDLKQPVLAVCLGMQLLADFSEENDTKCLGILPQTVKRFDAGDLKVPHMGWNNLDTLRSPIFEGVAEGERVYFVHGYYLDESEATIAAAEYGPRFSAAVQKDNFFGVQFHPEKSAETGAKILANFLGITDI
jgi:glutamine amidotransferase